MSASRARLVVVTSIVATLCYAVVLAGFERLPRYDALVVVVLAASIFRALDRASISARAVAIHTITAVLLGSLLVHLWTVGYEGRNAVLGGILPWSDSYDFYDDALRLVHGARFSEVSSKRPLFSTTLATLLRLTNGDLRLCLVVYAAFGAWATAAASLEVFRTHGYKSALVVWLVLFWFERRWCGFIQTEQLGLPFGVVGFVLLWRAQAAFDRDRAQATRLVVAGLVALSLGMMARAGPMFVLPALVIWAVRKLAPQPGRERWRMAGICGAALLLGIACHRVVLSFTGEGVTFSDYPGIAYGLLHGEDYTYLAASHPHLAQLAVAERVPEAWRIVVGEVRAHPSMFASSLAHSFGSLFYSPQGMFSYVWTNPDDRILEDARAVRRAMAESGYLGPLWLWQRELGTTSLLNAVGMALTGATFVVASVWSAFIVFVRRAKDPSLSLLRWVYAGVLLSAPFTPPWITSGQQVATVALAFLAALPAVVIFGQDASPSAPSPPAPGGRSRALVFAPFAFIAFIALAIAGLRTFPEPLPTARVGEHLVRLYPSTAVEITEERTHGFRTKTLADLRTALPFLAKHNPELTDSIESSLRPGTVFVAAFDAEDGHVKVLVDEARSLPELASREWLRIEATALASPNVLRVTKRF
ncbi:hypothetical protein AKJ09_09012 [Labilithrix luteola]|uniref:Glycosyltransferase RgtA/B/C/D-like domain-containing protein n=1 Tax=Labilithrix luteola TaxID=1391654 RepID=A0A0K1Q9D7_9BACT|nr:hypothetical protein [Labilithrix luteola]AKV02349.1 hypothetical protein AKJ09_09012 [Labilithrix luteola]